MSQSIPRKPSQNGRWPKIVIGIPMERTINEEAFWAFMAIAQKGTPFIKLPYTMRNDRARDMFVRRLLISNATHLLMLDSDHTHPRDIVARLARWVIDDPSRLVVGGLNFRRSEPFDPCAFLPDGRGGIYAPVEWPQGLVRLGARQRH